MFAIPVFLGLFFYYHNETLPVIVYLLSTIIVAVISFMLWLKKQNSNFLQFENSIKTRSLLSVSFPMFLTASSVFIMGHIDTIMLGIFRTEAEIGIYNIALRVATFINIFFLAIASIAAPKFAEYYGKNDMKGLQRIFQQSTKLIFWGSFPVVVAYFIFPESIFGEEFKAGVSTLMILAFGQFIHAISGPVGQILNMTNRQNILQYFVLSAATLNICLNYFLIQLYGYVGAAIATSVSLIVVNLLCVIYIRLKFKFYAIYLPFINLDTKKSPFIA